MLRRHLPARRGRGFREPAPAGESRLAAYAERHASVEGWFTERAQAIWDFLLVQQARMGVAGGFCEIGVWKGKSAFLGALHLRPDEPVVLVDVNSAEDVAQELRAVHPGPVETYRGRSSGFRASPLHQRHLGGIRFFHVDGEHSCHAAFGDLGLAAEMLGERGLVSVDDFGNLRYPQLLAAVYRFLFARPDFRMFLCGGNKAYLCRTEDFALYDGLVRSHLPGYLAAVGRPATLVRTSYAHDFGCFSVEDRVEGRDLIGRDEDPDDIPF